MASDAGNILKDEELFPDTVDTPKKGLEQHRKQEVVKGALSKRKILVIKTMNAWKGW